MSTESWELQVVDDQLRCGAGHAAELRWHFSEKCRIATDGNSLVAFAGGGRRLEFMMVSPSDGSLTLVRDHEQPPMGWISKGYDFKESTITEIWRMAVTGNSRGTTIMKFAGVANPGNDGTEQAR